MDPRIEQELDAAYFAARPTEKKRTFDLEFLDPEKARERLRHLYEEVNLYSRISPNLVEKKKILWAEQPLKFLEDVLPHRFKRQKDKPAGFGKFHAAMWQATNEFTNKPALICGFRGCGKSSLLNFGRHIYDICLGRVNYGIIGSFNEYKARRLLFPILMELEENPIIRQVYGNLIGDRVWSSKTFITSNNIRYEAMGIGQSSMGSLHNNFRPDVFVLDDIITTESARSEAQTDGLLYWLWSDIIPAMRPEPDGGYRGWILATMVSSLSPIYKMFYHEDYNGKVAPLLFNIKKDDGTPQWPERYTPTMIAQREASTPAYSWAGEFMMPPLPESDRLFNPKQILYYTEDDLRDRQLVTLAFNDPASRTTAKNDFSALICLSFDPDTHEFFVRFGSAYRRMTEDETVNQCYFLDECYGRIMIVFEGNGFQRLYQYIFDLQRQLRGYQPWVETITRTGNKQIRMMGLVPYLNHGKIKFLHGDPDQQHGINDLLKVTYQDGKTHDDFPDALIGAIEELQQLTGRIGLSAPRSLTTVDPLQQHQSVQELLAHRQQEYRPSSPALQTMVQDLLTPRKPTARLESSLEQRVKVALAQQRQIYCTRREYLDVRHYLQKWEQSYTTDGQGSKAAFAMNEIKRLDYHFKAIAEAFTHHV